MSKVIKANSSWNLISTQTSDNEPQAANLDSKLTKNPLKEEKQENEKQRKENKNKEEDDDYEMKRKTVIEVAVIVVVVVVVVVALKPNTTVRLQTTLIDFV